MSWTQHQASALKSAFDALDAVGIRWLVLRNHQGLPDINRSKDVDLGIQKTDFRRAEAEISKAVCAAGFDRVLVEEFQYVRCLTFFGTFGADPLSIKIDLLDGFVFRGAQLFDFRQLFADGRRYHGFTIPSAADDSVMLWIKPLLTGGIVKPKYVGDIQRIALDDPEGFRAVLERILTSEWASRAWAKISQGDIAGTVAMKGHLRRSAWLRALRRYPIATIRDAAHHVVSELSRRARRTPATFVSVAGPDGVGKTTFVENFSAGLAELQVKDPDAILVQHFRPHVFPNILTLLTGKTERIEAFHDPHRVPPASTPSSVLRIVYYWADYLLGYWAVTRRRCIAGRTVIFDRYFYDFIVDPRRSRLSLPRWVAPRLLALTPQPDLVFFLDADPDEIFARKQELARDEINRQLKAYRALAARAPRRFVRLDASQQPEAVVSEALRALVDRAYKRIGS